MLEKKGLKYIIQEETEHRQETIREDILANIRSCRFVIADFLAKELMKGCRIVFPYGKQGKEKER